MSATAPVADPADTNAPILVAIKALGESMDAKLKTTEQKFADKGDLETLQKVLNETTAELKTKCAALEVTVRENDLKKKYNGLDFASGADFFQTLVKAQRGDEDCKKRIFGDAGYVKRMDVILEQVYKAPSGFNTQSNEGEIFIHPEWTDEILRTTSSRSEVASRCRAITMAGNLFRWPALVDKNHTSSVSGGITIARTAEAAAATASTATWEFIEWKPNKLTGLAYVTEEMMEDATAFATLLPGLFFEAFDSQDEQDILFGTGVGEPLGMFNANNPSIVTVLRNTTTTIKTEDVLAMRARVYAKNWSNYVWIASQDIIPKLGVLSNANNVLYLSTLRTGEMFDTLMGRPLLYSDHMETVGTKNDLVLCDPTQYVVANKGGVTQQQSIHVRFLYGETAIRFVKRNDGRPLWRAALQPKKSTQATRSPFINLKTETS